MELIQQQDDSTCGIACAAMVAGVPFEVALAKGVGFIHQLGINSREMGYLLRRLNVRFTRLVFPELRRCCPHIVVVPSLNCRGGLHYVVADRSNAEVEVYDPQRGRPGKAYYSKRYDDADGVPFGSYAEVIRIDGLRGRARR